MLAFGVISAVIAMKVKRIITAFITPPAENEPSPLGKAIDAVSVIAARSLVAQAKTTFMGKQSGDSRAMAAVDGDIAQDLIGSQIPLLGGLLDSFPTLKKTLRRNPMLVDYAMSKIASMVGGKVQANGHTPASDTEPKFKL